MKHRLFIFALSALFLGSILSAQAADRGSRYDEELVEDFEKLPMPQLQWPGAAIPVSLKRASRFNDGYAADFLVASLPDCSLLLNLDTYDLPINLQKGSGQWSMIGDIPSLPGCGVRIAAVPLESVARADLETTFYAYVKAVVREAKDAYIVIPNDFLSGKIEAHQLLGERAYVFEYGFAPDKNSPPTRWVADYVLFFDRYALLLRVESTAERHDVVRKFGQSLFSSFFVAYPEDRRPLSPAEQKALVEAAGEKKR